MFDWYFSLSLEYQIAILAILTDIVMGWLPDKYLKWPGIVLAAAKKMHDYGSEMDEKTEADERLIRILNNYGRAIKRLQELERARMRKENESKKNNPSMG